MIQLRIYLFCSFSTPCSLRCSTLILYAFTILPALPSSPVHAVHEKHKFTNLRVLLWFLSLPHLFYGFTLLRLYHFFLLTLCTQNMNLPIYCFTSYFIRLRTPFTIYVFLMRRFKIFCSIIPSDLLLKFSNIIDATAVNL
jgi:hypothetical protein